MEKKEARKVVDKMIEIAGLDSQSDLAKVFGGISSQSISGAIAKGKIPERWYEIMEERFGVKQEEIEKPLTRTTSFTEQPYSQATREEEPARIDEKQDGKKEKYEILSTKFQSIFDFLIDTYGEDAFSVDSFLEKMRNDFLKKDRSYLLWQYAKQAEIEERLKKQDGKDCQHGFMEKESVNR
jgi:hypothetical protein